MNPFALPEGDEDGSLSMVNLASGVVATQEVSDALLLAYDTGEEQLLKRKDKDIPS